MWNTSKCCILKLFLKNKHPDFSSHSSVDANCRENLGEMFLRWYFRTEQNFSLCPLTLSIALQLLLLRFLFSVLGNDCTEFQGVWLKWCVSLLYWHNIVFTHNAINKYLLSANYVPDAILGIWSTAMNTTRSHFSLNLLTFWLEQITWNFLQRHCGWFNKLLKSSSRSK